MPVSPAVGPVGPVAPVVPAAPAAPVVPAAPPPEAVIRIASPEASLARVIFVPATSFKVSVAESATRSLVPQVNPESVSFTSIVLNESLALPPPDDAIVTLSLVASVVIVTFEPSTNSKVSEAESAITSV